MITEEERIIKARTIAFNYAQIDGAHHKMWVIDQMLQALLSEEEYREFLEAYSFAGEYDWDHGTAP